MESFYGGRQGASFVIVKRFDAIDIPETSYVIRYFAFDTSANNFILDENNKPIERNHKNATDYKEWKLHKKDGSSIIYTNENKEIIKEGVFPTVVAEGMIQCFSQGSATVDIVNYGEYVIIDTPDKNNLDNGKIYRRGLDYQGELGGAEYIGQIVGPQGDTAEISMDGFTTLVNKGGPQIAYEKDDIIPGMYLNENEEQQFNDAVHSSWVTIKDDFGIITGCKIGFQFPYHVFEFETERVSAYTTDQLIERIDEKEHPYYSKWKISIPDGIKGDALTNLQITNSMAKAGCPYYDNIECNGEPLGILENDVDILITNKDNYIENAKGKPIADPKSITRDVTVRYVAAEHTYKEIVVYKQTNYDNKTENINYISIGAYNTIKDVDLSEDGVLSVEYTYDNTKTFENKIQWIKDISIEANGEVKVIYNTDIENPQTINSNKPLQWIDNIEFNDTKGIIKVFYNTAQLNEDGTKIGIALNSDPIKWITETKLTNAGEIKVKYNTDSDIVEETGEIFEGHVINENFNPVRWIVENGIEIETNKITKDEDGLIIHDDGEGSGSQKVQVTYNTGEVQQIGNPLNYIIETVVTKDRINLGALESFKENGALKTNVAQNNHLLVIYSDPAYRQSLYEQGLCKAWQSKKFTNEDNPDGFFEEWYDLGVVSSDPKGVLVYKTVTQDFADENIFKKDENGIPTAESEEPPEILFGPGYEGWMLGISQKDTNIIFIYFYDYVTKKWTKIDEKNAETVKPENVIQINSSYNDPNTLTVKENGLVLINENNIVKNLMRKTDIGFSNPYYFGSTAKYINSTLNAGVNTLEEQLLIGFNTITEEWEDENNNIHVKTKFLTNENEQEYYILKSVIYAENNIKGVNFIIDNSSLVFENDKDQQFESKTDENDNTYYSLNLSNSDMYSLDAAGNVTVVSDILVKEDILSLCKDGNEENAVNIYKKQVTIQLADNGHKFTKEKIINLIS